MLSDEELQERDPVEVYQLHIDWEPSISSMNGRRTEASPYTRIYKLDDGSFVALMMEHVAEAIAGFEDAELHLISIGELERISDHVVHARLGPYLTLDAVKQAVATWRQPG